MAERIYDLKFGGYWREPNIGGIPSNSGIYCVYACTHNISAGTVSIRELLYIGESGDVRDRVQYHEKWTEWRGRLYSGEGLCFNAALISPSDSRERAEAAMIYHHKPPCNVEHVNNFPYDRTTIYTSGRSVLLDPYFVVNPTPSLLRRGY